MIAPPGCECQPEEPPGLTVIWAMATSVPNCSGMVPCEVSVPRANGVLVRPDGGVAQLGATVTATVTAVTTLASPALSSARLMARFMLPPDLTVGHCGGPFLPALRWRARMLGLPGAGRMRAGPG